MDVPADLYDALGAAAGTPRLLVTSDYDGTLAPLVSDPSAAFPHPEAVALFTALAALPQTSTALISGRSRADLAALSGMPPQIHLVGSHGAEFDTGFARPLDDDALALREQVLAELRRLTDGVDGVGMETKPASIAVHVRNASAAIGERTLATVREGPAHWAGVQVTEGKAVIELAVIDTDKGSAIELLRQQTDASAVLFFGDDVTDEKAFRRLGAADVGVKVGEGATAAEFRVSTTDDVIAALRLLLEQRRGP
ncbi:MAG: trehalose-phosphatase [Actinomycetota bacterium]|nr:trehalose-phosphatase [Actinomycetota bacterium]